MVDTIFIHTNPYRWLTSSDRNHKREIKKKPRAISMTPLEKKNRNHFAMIRFQSLWFQQIRKANSKEWIYSREFSQFNRDLSESVFFHSRVYLLREPKLDEPKCPEEKSQCYTLALIPFMFFFPIKVVGIFSLTYVSIRIFERVKANERASAARIGNIWLPKAVIWIFPASQILCLLTLNLAAILCFVQLNIGPKSTIPAKSAGFIDKHIEYFLLENTAIHTNTHFSYAISNNLQFVSFIPSMVFRNFIVSSIHLFVNRYLLWTKTISHLS